LSIGQLVHHLLETRHMNRPNCCFPNLLHLALVTLVAGTAACGSSSPTGPVAPNLPSTPTSGWLTLQLVTPHTNDGAVQFVVSGPGIDSVKAPDYNAFAQSDGTTANLIVTGQVGNGTVGRIFIPDLSKSSQYQASVVAAAARTSYALLD